MNLLILNPFSSTAYLSNKFAQINIDVTALFFYDFSKLDGYSAISANLFNRQVYIDYNDFAKLDQFMLENQFEYILNGKDDSTEVFDYLTSKYLPQYSNSMKTSLLRMDKFAMQQALSETSLPVIQTIEVDLSNTDINTLNLNYPVYCKPSISAGSIGGFFANNINELESNFQQLTISDNNKYLIQDYINGTEYILDAFSWNGVHHLINVAVYKKEPFNNIILCRYVDIVHDKKLWRMFQEYLVQMLDALEVKNGWTHNEVMLTTDNKIYLIELNNSISGAFGILQKMAQYVGLPGQDDAFVQLYHNHGNYNYDPIAQLSGYSRGLVIFKFEHSPIKDPQAILQKFKTFKEIIWIKKIGDIPKEIHKLNLLDTSCIIILNSNDLQLLEQESAQIFELEQNGGLI